MNELMLKENIELYKIRDKYVILDSDIAKLYGIETKRINEIIRRNKDLFNESVYFKLLDEEYDYLRSQNVTLRSHFATSKKEEYRGGRRYLPYVFTRDGVSILGSIMRGDKKANVTSNILNRFDELENQNNLIIKGENIENMIVEIRGKKVILDYDLAKLYECKNGTKEINQAVRNNPEKFPDDYMFQLTKEESKEFLRSKFLTLNKNGNNQGQHLKYLPYAFTEQGVLMLATILHTKVAIDTSIKIVDAFVIMKHYLNQNETFINLLLI